MAIRVPKLASMSSRQDAKVARSPLNTTCLQLHHFPMSGSASFQVVSARHGRDRNTAIRVQGLTSWGIFSAPHHKHNHRSHKDRRV
jgi:hypothetical protein